MNPYIRDYHESKYETKTIDHIDKFMHVEKTGELKIVHMNVRSVARNFDEFMILLNYLPIQFDIIVLSETFQINNLEMYNIEGYQIIYNEGTLNKNDGVLVYLKDHIEYTHKIINLGESKSIEIKINSEKNMALTAIYRSPQTCVDTFNKDLLTYLDNMNHVKRHVLIGDININLLTDNDFVDEYKNIMYTYGFMSIINECTRPEGNSCIDHIFFKTPNIENKLKNVEGYILQYLITDHFPVVLIIGSEKDIPIHQAKERKVKHYIEYFKLREDLLEESWSQIY